MKNKEYYLHIVDLKCNMLKEKLAEKERQYQKLKKDYQELYKKYNEGKI